MGIAAKARPEHSRATSLWCVYGQARVRMLSNYSEAFITNITGSA